MNELKQRLDLLIMDLMQRGWRHAEVTHQCNELLIDPADGANMDQAEEILQLVIPVHLGPDGWVIDRYDRNGFNVRLKPSEIALPDYQSVNQEGRKLQPIPFSAVALGAYVANNITAAEISLPPNKQAHDHLQRIVLAEFGVDPARVSSMNAELGLALGKGDYELIKSWTKQQYQEWVMGNHLLGVNYNALSSLIYDEDSEQEMQSRN